MVVALLPPLARWEYGFQPPVGSREALLTEVFTRPQEWFTDHSLEEKCRPLGAVD